MSNIISRGRGRPRRFTAAKEATIARRHRNGMTTAELAEHYDTSRSTILAIVARNPAPTAAECDSALDGNGVVPSYDALDVVPFASGVN